MFERVSIAVLLSGRRKYSEIHFFRLQGRRELYRLSSVRAKKCQKNGKRLARRTKKDRARTVSMEQIAQVINFDIGLHNQL